MKIGLYQFPVGNSVPNNLTRIRKAAGEAAAAGVRLLVLPECALCGYPPATVDETAFVLPESSAKSTAPSDGFGISAPEDWVGSDRTLIQDKDTDPGLSLPADGGSMPKLRIAPVP